jgi:hypothetical protein
MAGGRQTVDYPLRYCAFIDILGFSELIARLTKDPRKAKDVRTLLRGVHSAPPAKYMSFFATSDLKAQSISDALCLSAAPTAPGLAHLFFSLEELSRRLLREGYFLRGAVVKGRLYHDDKMVFGDALVRAYRLEMEVVRYPRIIITSDVIKEVAGYVDDGFKDFENCYEQAEDGPYFLNALAFVESILNSAKGDDLQRYIEGYNRVAAKIQRRFDEAVDNPRHFEKVQWFARLWNRKLAPFRRVTQIRGPGVAAK